MKHLLLVVAVECADADEPNLVDKFSITLGGWPHDCAFQSIMSEIQYEMKFNEENLNRILYATGQ